MCRSSEVAPAGESSPEPRARLRAAKSSVPKGPKLSLVARSSPETNRYQPSPWRASSPGRDVTTTSTGSARSRRSANNRARAEAVSAQCRSSTSSTTSSPPRPMVSSKPSSSGPAESGSTPSFRPLANSFDGRPPTPRPAATICATRP